jgi:hypothetical protein
MAPQRLELRHSPTDACLRDSAILKSLSDMQHVAPLEQYGVNHVQPNSLQHGQPHQGSHALLASRRTTLSSPSVSRRVQGVLRKPAKVVFLRETMSLVIKGSEPNITADLPEQILSLRDGRSAVIYIYKKDALPKLFPTTDNTHDVSSESG